MNMDCIYLSQKLQPLYAKVHFILNFHVAPPEGYIPRFIPIALKAAVRWFFEHGYAKKSARYFQAAKNSFRTLLKKLFDHRRLNIMINGECSRTRISNTVFP